jgi:ATPase subunit of ABC transporter with duplicated ATPase domains
MVSTNTYDAMDGLWLTCIIAYVSMQRIEKFLDEEEVPAWATSLQKHDGLDNADAIRFQHASFSWSSSSGDRFTLGPLDIAFPHGKLSIVCGATAAGKSTLLLSLLGETSCLSGQVFFDKSNHRVAYCAQNPCGLLLLSDLFFILSSVLQGYSMRPSETISSLTRREATTLYVTALLSQRVGLSRTLRCLMLAI